MRLFAEHFLLPVEDPDDLSPEPVYDEVRGLNLDPEGRVFVEHIASGGTDTLTEVDGEHQDRDSDDDFVARTETITKVRNERPDISNDERYPGEARSLMGTETAVGGEPTDYADGEAWAGTQTFVRSEKEDFSRELEESEQAPLPARGT